MNIIFLILLFCMILSLKTKLTSLQILLFEIYTFYISEIDVYRLLQIYYGTKERIKPKVSYLGLDHFLLFLEDSIQLGWSVFVSSGLLFRSLSLQSSVPLEMVNPKSTSFLFRLCFLLLRSHNLWVEEQIQCKWYIFSRPRYCHCS